MKVVELLLEIINKTIAPFVGFLVGRNTQKLKELKKEKKERYRVKKIVKSNDGASANDIAKWLRKKRK